MVPQRVPATSSTCWTLTVSAETFPEDTVSHLYFLLSR
jgi:hypothetical protein